MKPSGSKRGRFMLYLMEKLWFTSQSVIIQLERELNNLGMKYTTWVCTIQLGCELNFCKAIPQCENKAQKRSQRLPLATQSQNGNISGHKNKMFIVYVIEIDPLEWGIYIINLF